ncbi:F-box associated domain, type 1 [Artemisia annua]|uniref:F-box associated domain, type 1 n=1 Tax=Artemisia annua TaxID=35608 RepID=A0A2U1LAL3_ARTAN|nr:F-box associated domain, type 1 [Artemisia annua]
MSDFDDNILWDIFSRLDVKTIIYCKCACKRWRDLVLDPHFINKLHLLRSLASPQSLIIHGLQREDYPLMNNYGHHGLRREVSFRRPGFLKWVEIQQEHDGCQLNHVRSHNLSDNNCNFPKFGMITVGSVNGLICMYQRPDRFFIFNPVFEEYMTLPKPKLVEKRYHLINYGFGFSMASGEYKVIRICRKRNPRSQIFLNTYLYPPEIEVYTLGTDQWRTLGPVPYPDRYETAACSSISLNGHVHWIIWGKIYAFDLDMETFKAFPSPTATGDCNKILGVLKGCLSQFSWSKFRFTVFVMREYGISDSWYQEVHTPESILRKEEFERWSTWKPLCLINGLNGTTSNLIAVHENKFLVHCLDTNTYVQTNLLHIYSTSTVMTYHPKLLKLHKFGADRVHPFNKSYGLILKFILCLQIIEYIAYLLTLGILDPGGRLVGRRLVVGEEYKVIQIYRKRVKEVSTDSGDPPSHDPPEIEVYTLGTDHWRPLGPVPYSYERLCPLLNRSSIFFHGRVHWIFFDGGIYGFDFDDETFQYLFQSPPSRDEYYKILGVLKGRLCQFTWSSCGEYTLWVMKEYGINDSWYKEVAVAQSLIPDVYSYWVPLCLIDGPSNGSILIFSHGSVFLAYHLDTNLILQANMMRLFYTKTAIPYRPSFLKLSNFGAHRVHAFNRVTTNSITYFLSKYIILSNMSNPTPVA